MSFGGPSNSVVRDFVGGVRASAYWIGNRLLSASDVVNDSTVTGASVKLALETLSTGVSNSVSPYLALSLADQAILSYDTTTSAWRGKSKEVALKGTGNFSICVGTYAVAGGVGDIMLGSSCGNASNTGTNNIGIGTDTIDGATEALSNIVAIGNTALSGALTAAANGAVAIGFESLKVMTSGAQNTAAGYQSGVLTTTGSRNSFFGYGVTSPAAANDNTFTGNQVGSTSVGSRNTAVGSQAFNSASAAVTDTVVLGYNALTAILSSTAPSGSVAIGSTALQACTTGLNTAVGFANQLAVTTGTRNTTLGYNVMSNASAAVACSDFVGIGSSALTGALTAAANGAVAVGVSALAALTSGARNTAVGYQAGNILTTGSNMTILGYDADGDANSRSGCVVLGTGATASADDTLVVRMGNTSTKEIVITPVVDATPPAGAVTYLPITIGGTSYRILLQAP